MINVNMRNNLSKSLLRPFNLIVLSVLSIILTSTAINMAEDLASKDQASLSNFNEAEIKLADGISTFGQKLHKIIRGDGNFNMIFSPLSIHSAISMVSLGTESGSGIEKQLIDILGYKNVSSAKDAAIHNAYGNIMKHFKYVTETSEMYAKDNQDSRGSSSRPPVLDIWNAAVIDKTELKAPFKQTLQQKYNTSIKQVGDDKEANQAALNINEWGKQAGFSGDLVKPSDLIVEPESLILLSAVKIQGWWMKSLREHQVDQLFYNLGDPKQLVGGVALMQTELDGKYAIFSANSNYEKSLNNSQTVDELDKLEFRVAQIPLIGDMTFTLVEPLNNGSINGLAKLESDLMEIRNSGEKTLLDKALDKLSDRNVTFERVQFPKFKYENDINLKQILTSMGLEKLFTKQSSLNDITNIPMLISKVQHQALIEVDKNGLKGGAITRVIATKLSLMIRRNPIKMIVQNPFMFMIRYKSITLFMGHVVQI